MTIRMKDNKEAEFFLEQSLSAAETWYAWAATTVFFLEQAEKFPEIRVALLESMEGFLKAKREAVSDAV